MTSYVTVEVMCPHCKTGLRHLALASTNSFGAIWFTDGYAHNGPAHENAIQKCSACGYEFWMHDTGTMPNTEPKPMTDRWEAGQHKTLSVGQREYPRLLKAGFFTNNDEEFHLRFNMWHLTNHRFRKNVEKTADLTEFETQNMERLMELLGDKPHEGLYRSEILRNLGRFDESLEVLDTITEERLMPFINKIREGAIAKQRAPIQVSSND
jgi:hypothetical protein